MQKNWMLHYFKEVLGVQSLIRPQRAVAESAELQLTSKALKVVFVASENLKTPEKDLLGKIFEAIKIEDTSKRLLYFKPSEEASFLEQVFIAEDIVCFEDEMAQYLRSHLSDLSIIQLVPLNEMISHPEKKKSVWAQLKSLMETKWNS